MFWRKNGGMMQWAGRWVMVVGAFCLGVGGKGRWVGGVWPPH